MPRTLKVRALVASALGTLVVAAVSCGSDEKNDSSGGSGGVFGAGGGFATGGALASGGAFGAGGAFPGSGGALPPGGGGGIPPVGGAGGAGGDTATGGLGGMGGDPGTGGAGGAPPACDASVAPNVGRLGLAPEIPVSAGLNAALYALQPPGSDDWYVVERGGRIRIWSGGSLRPTPFLDLSAEFVIPATYDERGLYSIAFPPDYQTSGRFYVVMTPTDGAAANHDLVLEFQRSGDPNVADAGSRRAILDLLPGGNEFLSLLNQVHNGGQIAFGPDGMLYVGMGDGGGASN